MTLDKLRAAAEREALSWARDQGIEGSPPVLLSAPPPHVDADASLPWPLAAAKAVKRKPLDVAKALAERLQALPEVASAEPVPPGFVNLKLSDAALLGHLSHVLGGAAHGADPGIQPRSILIEFVSANPTGPVHLASGRAATLGDSLARILARRGHKVKTEYYVNDVGRQVRLLGESVKARWEEARGKEAALPEGGYQGEYVKEVAAAAPAEAEGWSAEDFSRFAVERMLAEHRADMEAFGVRFDRWFRESELHGREALDAALEKLKGLGRVKEKEGAWWLSSAAAGAEDEKDRVLVRSDGRPTYFLADVAYHQDKLDRGFNLLVDILGADHHGYVPRMRDAIAALGYPKDAFHPIVHQLVHLFRGKEAVRMSKRAGEFLRLRDLVEEAGVDACRFFFAMRSPNAHMNFDVELAKKQSQENPVYYVQYVHARIASIFREAPAKGVDAAPAKNGELSLLKDPAERALLNKMAWFPEALRSCERELSPHPLAGYLMELAGLFHPFYERCRVLDASASDLSRARLTLCRGVQAVIADGLGLLGVSRPEKM